MLQNLMETKQRLCVLCGWAVGELWVSDSSLLPLILCWKLCNQSLAPWACNHLNKPKYPWKSIIFTGLRIMAQILKPLNLLRLTAEAPAAVLAQPPIKPTDERHKMTRGSLFCDIVIGRKTGSIMKVMLFIFIIIFTGKCLNVTRHK